MTDKILASMDDYGKLVLAPPSFFPKGTKTFPPPNDEDLTKENWGCFASDAVLVVAAGGCLPPKSIAGWFDGFRYLEAVDLLALDCSSVSDATRCFRDCDSLVSIDVMPGFGTSCTCAAEMFSGCASLEDACLASWRTGNLKDAFCMFYGCEALTSVDISEWDLSMLEDARSMFQSCVSMNTLALPKPFGSSSTRFTDMLEDCTSLTQMTQTGER